MLRRGAIELVATVTAALFFALAIQAYAVKPYRIPSGSMEPTLKVGERILVNRFSHRIGGDPGLNDITVFIPPRGADTDACGHPGEGPFYQGPGSSRPCSQSTGGEGSEAFVKRVVGLPGDTIAVRHGHVIRNGKPAREPFASECEDPSCNLDPITVAPGHYFMMGDNRGFSDDSRYWGPVARGQIIGRAVLAYWPLGRLGGL